MAGKEFTGVTEYFFDEHNAGSGLEVFRSDDSQTCTIF